MPKLYQHGLVLFAFLAALAALDAALAAVGLVSWFNGLRWLRVHIVTLGIITQLSFGLFLWAPRHRWGREGGAPISVWLLLSAGICALLVGIPLMSQPIIIVGGFIVFGAALVVLRNLLLLKPGVEGDERSLGRPFFLAALAFLLLGVVVGAGLWAGWGRDLRMSAPREVHIHANTWGFASLAFAGLLADWIRRLSGHGISRPRDLGRIFWLLIVSGVLLLIGPWIGSLPVQGVGILLHLAAAIWLLVLILPPLSKSERGWAPWNVHIAAGYLWILGLAAMVPVVLLLGTEFTLASVEETAPQVLVYGWALQVAMGLAPRVWTHGGTGSGSAAALEQSGVAPEEPSAIRSLTVGNFGGWLTVLAINMGSALLAASILLQTRMATLYGWGYGFLAFGLAVFALRLRQPMSVDD
jgi:hypothetical protein